MQWQDSDGFPKKEVRKPGDVVADLIRPAGGQEFAAAVLYRNNDLVRSNAKTDPQALRVWYLKLLAIANKNGPTTPYMPGTVTREFLREVVRLSWSDDDPKLAEQFLKQHAAA